MYAYIIINDYDYDYDYVYDCNYDLNSCRCKRK